MLFRLIRLKFIFDQLLIGRSNRFGSLQPGCCKLFFKNMAESPEGWIFQVDKNNCVSFEATTLRIFDKITRSHHKIALSLFPEEGNLD